MQHIDNALSELAMLKKQYKKVLLSYSGGKDSTVMLHLCQKIFKPFEIEGFFMYLTPDFPDNEEVIAFSIKAGLSLNIIEHWIYSKFKKNGIFCIPDKKMPQKTLSECYLEIRADTGIEPILCGAKATDSAWRRSNREAGKNLFQNVFMPLWHWTQYDIEQYCRLYGLETLKSDKNTRSGVDLDPRFLCWLFDNYPKKYEIIKHYFPFIDVVLARREYYGIV